MIIDKNSTWTPEQQKVAEEFWKKEPIKRDGIDFELLAQAGSIRRERVRKNKLKIIYWIITVIFPVFCLSIILIQKGTLMNSTQWVLIFCLLFYGSYYWLKK